jgi:hypothetical protein
MSTYQPLVAIAGHVEQLDDPDGLDVAHLTSVDYVQFDTTYNDGSAEGKLQWNIDDGTLEVGMPGGNVNLQIGQEHLVRCRNITGNTINNGAVVYISGEEGNKPLIALSKADAKETTIVFGVATENIAHNDNGFVTTTGQVRTVNTSGLNEGSYVFLSATTAGGLETFPAEAPSYKARIGYCLREHSEEGAILVDSSVVNTIVSLSDVYTSGTPNGYDVLNYITANTRWELAQSQRMFFNGTFRETFDALLSSNGTAITFSLEQADGGDLTMQFSDGDTILDCTPAQTLNITPGTDTSPVGAYIYIPKDTKTLTANDTDWPHFTEHIKIAYLFVPSATFVLDHGGAYVNQNWNDHLSQGGSEDQGHLAHLTNKIRQLGTDWHDGVNGDGATASYFTIASGDVRWSSTDGLISQLHPHVFPAIDSSGTDVIIVRNDNVAPYKHIQNLFDITDDSTGATIGNNRYFNLTFWGVINKTGQYSGIFINLPSGFYTLQSEALTDSNNYDDYSFPREFSVESGTAFLIARGTFQMGSTWSHIQTNDLRGQSPSRVAGTATSDHGALGGLADDDHLQYALVDGTRAFTGSVNVTGGHRSSDETSGATADVAVAKVGGGTRTLTFKDGLYISFADS